MTSLIECVRQGTAPEVLGCIDGCDGRTIYGWVAARGCAPLVVEALCGDQVVGMAIADIERADVARAFGLAIYSGFSIELGFDDETPTDLPIRVRVKGTGIWLPGETHFPPAPVRFRPVRPMNNVQPAQAVDVIIPVYAGREETLQCIRAVLSSPRPAGEIIVINDASPDPALSADLLQMSKAGAIRLVVNQKNQGFPASVNSGMRENPSHDVVLLNSDTIVSGTWLHRLAEAAYRGHDVGTVTPLSNSAEILSYPSSAGSSRPVDAAMVGQLDALASHMNAGHTVEIPTAIGFCMYIRRDCLDEVGLFDEVAFGRGYGEENDFSMRARRLGWRHLAASNVFVGHVGGVSFGTEKALLCRRAGALIERRYPGYDALIQTWRSDDPLMVARRGLDLARWRPERAGVLLVVPNRDGGIARHVADRIEMIEMSGRRAVIVRPVERLRCRIEDSDAPELVDLVYHPASELDELLDMLKDAQIERAEIHHFLDHDPAVLELVAQLGCPLDLVVHDYSWMCPRISFLNAEERYCGEPEIEGCERCLQKLGSAVGEIDSVAALRARSRQILDLADRIIVPTRDVAARFEHHFPGLPIEVHGWEDTSLTQKLPKPSPQRPNRRRRVCLIGAIGPHKGYRILLECARDAARRDLPLEFTVIGHTANDTALFATGRVTATGKYEEDDAADLVRQHEPDLAFLPSIVPETWCYTLTTAWKAGLRVVAFDRGAIAERIRNADNGVLISPQATAREINEILMQA